VSAGDASQLIAFLSGENVEISDWPRLVEAAGETLTIGILADRALAREGELSLQSIHDLLTEVRERARARNARIREQFAELLAPLNEIGVEPIPMKGLARLLGSTTNECRLLSDIDIMVPADRRDACAEVMSRLGYVPTEEPDARAPVVFGRGSDVGSVDLHTRLRPFYLDLGYEELARLCRGTQLASGTVLMPSPTGEALMLIAHDQLHDADYWRGLVDVRHLLDLEEIIDEGIDWPALAAVFPTGSCRRAMEVALLTVRELVGADVPPVYRGGAWAGLQVRRRRLQARLPALQHVLTLLTIAADPPRLSGPPTGQAVDGRWRGTLHRRFATYLRGSNPGKTSLGVRPRAPASERASS
jgi:hypothetical protein